ncbi:hypothetical protein [Natranaeroarchaeum aerophilus]|uniref:Uncharacterized protein n=1 Tax=Natranaeroarchaeum aerophilus TaxID=2917711 RepID=A0AAE3FN13_9EURY|nr:hypothetical protein [Natranaeroarchaeum aerophilus]MCL9812090.1 hypothetical protein [Natranaeroarchaeum aerophilus]
MRQTLTTIVVALAIVVALFGAVGFVSADATNQQSPQTNGPVGTMADHAPGQFGEMMDSMATEHVPGMHGTEHAHGPHHAEHEHGEHHAEHEPREQHTGHQHSERHAGNGEGERHTGHGGHC